METPITTSEAAKILELSPQRVRELARKGKLPFKRFGANFVFDRAEVLAFKKLPRPVGWEPGKPRKVPPAASPGATKGRGR